MLTALVGDALVSPSDVACWEARQKPFEHPKLYDPVSRETTWCSHACVLLQRTAFEKVGGYDERIFLYAEDVEFSYRLREAGYELRYVPKSVVWHYTYEEAAQVKPAQYVGSIVGNLFLRLRYGSPLDALVAFPLSLGLLLRNPFEGSRKALFKALLSRFYRYIPGLLLARKRAKGVAFPFRLMDYEATRIGAFTVALQPACAELPLVSIVTRTVKGRAYLLRQAGLSVLNQTYPNIEWVVVEDGGDFQQAEAERFNEFGVRVKYRSLPKVGRSRAGNVGMEIAAGDWLMFLDDDDLLYADHVETLMDQLLLDPALDASYSLAWQVESEVSDGGASVQEGVYEQVSSLRQPFNQEQLAISNYIPIQAIIFRKSLFVERGGFDESLEFLEDWHLWRRYAVGSKFCFVEKTTSLYRVPLNLAIRAKRQGELDDAYVAVKALGDTAVAQLETSLTARQ